MANDKPEQSSYSSNDEANIAVEAPTAEATTDVPRGKSGLPHLIAGCLIYTSTWGLATSFGVYQAYYSTRLIPNEPQSRIAWIGSMTAFLLTFPGFLVGPLLDAGYLHFVLAAGTILMCFGLMMTSLCHEFYQLLLSQGVIVGLGAGLLVPPAMSIPATWYTTPGERAMVFTSVGTAASIGGIIFPVMFHYIQRDAGWRWAVRAIAFVTLGTNLCALALMRYKEIPTHRRKLFVLAVWKERTFQLICFGGFFSYMVFLTPLNWIEAYALHEQPTMSHDLSFWLVAIAMAAGIPGRIILSFVSTKTGPLNAFIFTTVVCGVIDLAWMAVHSTSAIVGFAFVAGFFVLGFMALTMLALLALAPTMEHIHTRIGMALGVSSFGLLSGLPLAGQILWSTGSYKGLQAFAGSVFLASALPFLWIRYSKVGGKLAAKI